MNNVKCERCGKETIITIMSTFNTQMICEICEKLEKDHPRYAKAKEAELQAVKNGNYNFPGIGLPLDLQLRS